MNEAVLYVVATPIGNRDDLSLRAIEILKSVDVIAAEDTRHSKRLLEYHQIKTPLLSLHEHNESQRLASLLARLEQGQNLALISDAGTPLISDPGYRLVSAVREKSFRVVPVPGACAAITALCASGLPTDRFVFEGFLPVKRGARQKHLKSLLRETRTLIFYESTHRIVDTLEDMLSVFGAGRRGVIARELTKSFETIHEGAFDELLIWIKQDQNQQKGEFVVLVDGASDEENSVEEAEVRRLLSILLKEMPLKQAVAIATDITQGQRKSLYQLALELKNNS
ncbi:MAG: 16S rRNA (cytidine(1402)-2'-O)-methyltransferase [Coxiellaceae bacterium]|nr:16S rRNA (cytidine(1402)-2'-O)-methyltransferase [Coxiellaceae bacterium]